MTLAKNLVSTDTDAIYQRLMLASNQTGNDHLLASIISSWATGSGCLPRHLGLEESEYQELFYTHFPDYGAILTARNDLEMVDDRFDEREEVTKLLLLHRADNSETEQWVAKIITSACQGQDHLLQDLGVWTRQDLSDLLAINFPGLAEKNIHDMKWKKFIYKQLCISEGIYTCRAPSCEVCVDYQVCFGPEE